MEYHAVVTAMTVLIKGKAIFDESATVVEIEDTTGGPFIRVKQTPDSKETQEILMDELEWPLIRDTIDRMFESCKQLEEK